VQIAEVQMKFSAVLNEECKSLLRVFAEKSGALLPILHLVQQEQGYISAEAMEWVAQFLDLKPAQVRGVVEFYAVFRTQQTGRCRIQVCRTLSCRYMGAEEVIDCLREHLGIDLGEVTADGRFALEDVDCLGSCSTAPAMLVDGHLHQSLTREYLAHLLETLG
jgi:NADH-quinone oxidoreductase subunit E